MFDRTEFSCYENQNQPKEFIIKANELDRCLKTKDSFAIINNPNTFLAAILKAFPKESKEDSFKVKEEYSWFGFSHSFRVILDGVSLQKEFHENIEIIRKYFIEGLSGNKNFNLFYLKFNYVTRLTNDPAELTKLTKICNIAAYYIKAAIPGLANFCGASCSETIEEMTVAENINNECKKKVTILKITWNRNQHLIFAVSVKKLREPLERGGFFYQDYLIGKGCDFTLKSSEGIAIKVHSTILRHCASEPFKAMFELDMQEIANQEMELQDFSEHTIRAFMDYFYIGGPAFMQRAVSPDLPYTLNLPELLHFAQLYNDEELTNCCTNLFALIATHQDKDNVVALAEQYNNDHLKELAEKI